MSTQPNVDIDIDVATLLVWHQSEIYTRGLTTFHEGYTATVYPHEGEAWFWRVDATSLVSEYPEIVNCDMALTQSEAIRAAEACLNRATNRRTA